jgi:hypothetical protein
MLALYGFGQPSLLAVIQAIQERARLRTQSRGLGELVHDFAAYASGGLDAVYVSPDGAVYCSKIKPQNYQQCKLNKAGEAGRAPIREMQRAVDRFINLVTSRLQGRALRGIVAREDGTQEEMSITIDNLRDPIAKETGYDGIVGPSTRNYVAYAMTVAGILKRTDAPDVKNGVAVTNVWAHPTRPDLMAAYSKEIASYLDGVSRDFDALISAYEARKTPAQTPVDNPDTLPYVVPQAVQEPRVKLGRAIIGTAAMLGVTTVGAIAAGKKKAALDAIRLGPALGRHRRRTAALVRSRGM